MWRSIRSYSSVFNRCGCVCIISFGCYFLLLFLVIFDNYCVRESVNIFFSKQKYWKNLAGHFTIQKQCFNGLKEILLFRKTRWGSLQDLPNSNAANFQKNRQGCFIFMQTQFEWKSVNDESHLFLVLITLKSVFTENKQGHTQVQHYFFFILPFSTLQ